MSGTQLTRGRLVIAPGVFLAPGAIVCGDVTIGTGSSVWFNTVIRGDTDRIEIGEHTNIQDLTMVHIDEGCPAIIGSRVTIGHRVIVHCLIGMGAIILSGARIGAGSLVGAGALVREREVIPPGSLVLGVPARVAGEVQPSHREAIAHGAAHYEALAADYVAQGLGQPIPPPTGLVLGGGARG